MQVIRHRNSKKQQNQRHTDGGPFLERVPQRALSLVNPPRAPGTKDACRYQHPHDIEE